MLSSPNTVPYPSSHCQDYITTATIGKDKEKEEAKPRQDGMDVAQPHGPPPESVRYSSPKADR